MDAIASGLADALGGAGYVTVGPLPANASADGSPRIPNRFLPGMLRQPVETSAATAQVVNTTLVRFALFFSILPTFDTVFRVNESFRLSDTLVLQIHKIGKVGANCQADCRCESDVKRLVRWVSMSA